MPLAGLMDAVGAITNQAMAIYDMGPWATAAEWAMVSELGRHIGWAEGTFSGLATDGGSLANLTALLTARNVALPDCWRQGTPRSDIPPLLVVHADAHYSVARTAGILGLGTQQVVRVGLDARRRMDPQKLDDTLADRKRRGHPIVAVAPAHARRRWGPSIRWWMWPMSAAATAYGCTSMRPTVGRPASAPGIGNSSPDSTAPTA